MVEKISLYVYTMRKNEVEDLLLSEIEEVKGGSSSSTCICERGGAGETVITLPTNPVEPGNGTQGC